MLRYLKIKKHLNLVPKLNKYPKLTQQYPNFSYLIQQGYYNKIIPSSFSRNYRKIFQQYSKLYKFIILHKQHRFKTEKENFLRQFLNTKNWFTGISKEYIPTSYIK